MRRSAVREVRDAVADASRRASDPIELERAVAAQVARVVPYDLWCGLTLDPVTVQPTGGYHGDGLPVQRLPRLVELEHGAEPDVGSIRALADDAAGALRLSDATDGDPMRSARYREIFEPSGIRHELRVACRGDGGMWGALIFMRGADVADFSPAEISAVAGLSRTVAEGLRRATVLNASSSAQLDGPGLLLCSVGDHISLDHASETARAWLDEVNDGTTDGLPAAVASLVWAAHHSMPGEQRARMRTRTGRWLTVYAERIGPSGVSVIVEPTRAHEIAGLLADAYRLSAREREVAALAVRGLTNAEIGARLYLSPYTVQDHLKNVFGKTGVGSRMELAALLWFDHAAE
jgi:DNA-binding CsgD family transcriptional regulator/GAF domain-containing protein